MDYLKEQLQTTYKDKINYEEDWKLLTILIGANNLCGACYNRSYADPAYFAQQMDLVLSKVQAELPRTFVNLLPIFNIGQVHGIAEQSEYCRFMWKDIVKTECMCLQGEATQADRDAMDARAAVFREIVFDAAAKWSSLNNPNFTVVAQPFTANLTIPSLSFISEMDCFHPSALANQGMSVGLWNNMMVPQPLKQHNINPNNVSFICPVEGQFLQ